MGNPKVKGYIICETGAFSVPTSIKTVDSPRGPRAVINTTLQDADVKNRNKRVYPKSVLQNGLNSEYVRERIATNTWFGEAGHPLKPDIQRQLYIDQSNMSHKVVRYWWENNLLKGTVEAAATARGDDFHGVVMTGSRVGFSLRAVGPITEQRGDYVIVQDPLTIFCYDWILHPSHRVAYADVVAKAVQESAKAGNVICESAGVFVPSEEVDKALGYLKDQSRAFRMISEQLELETEGNVYLSEDMRKVYITQGDETVAIFTEDYISREISDHMARLYGDRIRRRGR